jgi:hypothetical protein
MTTTARFARRFLTFSGESMMKCLGSTIAVLLVFANTSFAQDPAPLNEHLKVFQPLIGKTFKGEFADSTPQEPKFDVSRWERAMNGMAVRCLHSVNDGIYGGETILMWDPKQQKVAFWYFTTAGFYTQGTMDVGNHTWSSLEKVTGNAQGISEVRATSEFTSDGSLHVKSEYLHDGKWEKGHEIKYVESPDARVIFK